MWSTVVPKNWYIKLFYRLNIFRVIMNQKWVLFFLGHPVVFKPNSLSVYDNNSYFIKLIDYVILFWKNWA